MKNGRILFQIYNIDIILCEALMMIWKLFFILIHANKTHFLPQKFLHLPFFNSESFWNLPVQLPCSSFIESPDDVCLFTPCRGDKKVICNKFVQQVSSVCYSLAYIVTEELLFQGNLHNHLKEEHS